jgi:hypothetical protein
MNEYELALKADVARLNAEVAILESKLAQAKADFAGAMGSVIVAEALAKDEAEKREKALADWALAKDEAEKREKALADWALADKAHAERLARANAKLAEAKTYIERGIENGDITEDELGEPFWTDLFDLLGVITTEEIEVIIDIRVLATVTKPRGEDVTSYDFDLDSLEISANGSGWEIEVSEQEITDVNEA